MIAYGMASKKFQGLRKWNLSSASIDMFEERRTASYNTLIVIIKNIERCHEFRPVSSLIPSKDYVAHALKNIRAGSAIHQARHETGV